MIGGKRHMFERALWITADPNNKDPNKKWNVRTKIEEMPPGAVYHPGL